MQQAGHDFQIKGHKLAILFVHFLLQDTEFVHQVNI